ncbi:hypothetical protein GCM10007916_00890 [Psychromonas marina]|uniref:Uncharacterized protein n=1 Tax=Psychromonas marina TaxID=88364 RepID=A0ABQ6DVD5_9GAMM|nr:hypothetical protein [Psychromonas marina]GLS89022.1 hypothetical protein GCM10007916_00890 [Psychromonas marina]
MHEILIIDDQYRDKMAKISNKLDKRGSDCCVSFIIDPKKNTLQLIGGHAPQYLHFTLPLAKNHQLKKRRFTVDGEYFSQIPTYAGKGNSMLLKLIDAQDSPNLMGISTDKNEFLSCELAPFCKAHKAFIQESVEYVYEDVRALEVSRLLHEVTPHAPVQFVAFDKENKEMRVQSDNNLELHDIPSDVPIPTSMVLTQAAADDLKTLCDDMGDNHIQIAQHGENITFKTDNITITHSLTGVDEFYKNEPKAYKLLGYMVMDINHLKKRVGHFHYKYSKIKQANQSHLLIEPTQLYFINFVKPYEFEIPIATDAISFTETQLYMLHLRDIIPIKIKDVTTSDKIKIAILKEIGQESEYKLGFYKDITHKYPYASIAIDPAPDDMSQAQAVIKNAKDSEGGGSHREGDGPDDDLFGFHV